MVGKTIIILDENTASRIFLANALREKQFKVLEASSATEASIITRRDEPDLVLFDPVLTDLKMEITSERICRGPIYGSSSYWPVPPILKRRIH